MHYSLGKEKGIRGQRIQEDGKDCITNYRLLAEGTHLSYVEITIETGRLHQIRAGMEGIGHPLLGDKLHTVF